MAVDLESVPNPICKHAHQARSGLICALGFNPYWLGDGVRPFDPRNVPCYPVTRAYCRHREIEGVS